MPFSVPLYKTHAATLYMLVAFSCWRRPPLAGPAGRGTWAAPPPGTVHAGRAPPPRPGDGTRKMRRGQPGAAVRISPWLGEGKRARARVRVPRLPRRSGRWSRRGRRRRPFGRRAPFRALWSASPRPRSRSPPCSPARPWLLAIARRSLCGPGQFAKGGCAAASRRRAYRAPRTCCGRPPGSSRPLPRAASVLSVDGMRRSARRSAGSDARPVAARHTTARAEAVAVPDHHGFRRPASGDPDAA